MDANEDADMFMEADLSYAIYVGDMDDMGDEEMMMKRPEAHSGHQVDHQPA